MTSFRSLFIVLVFCVGCDKPLPTLDGIDSGQWADDKNACGSARAAMHDAIDQEKEKLLGLDQMQIVSLLGKPDQNELSRRNQKFFYYFLDPAPACGTPDSAATRLVIRFNAVGLAKEVLITDGL